MGETAYEFENRKSVVLVIGVNGVGKTTSVGKLAGKLKDQGKKVILAAADTFRAAAGEQLARVGKPCRCGDHRRTGRLLIRHRSYMMRWQQPKQEMRMCCSVIPQDDFIIRKTLWKNCARSTGSLKENIRKHIWRHWSFWTEQQDRMRWHRQSSLQKLQMSHGIILTKLDGTAKGGIAVAIQSELGYSGQIYRCRRDSIDDLQKFDADAFVNALFDVDEKDLGQKTE